MNQLFKTIVTIFLLCMSFTPLVHAAPENTNNNYIVGKPISLKGLDNKKTFYLLEKATLDLNGDKVPDQFLLIGQKDSPDSLIAKDVHVVVLDGKDKKEHIYLLRDEASYSPIVQFADITGDNVPEIINEFTTQDGNEKIILISSLKDNKPTVYTGKTGVQRFFVFKGEFKDNFIAEITNTYLYYTFPVSVLGYKTQYIKDGIYDKKGKLLKPVKLLENKTTSMEVKDLDSNGVKELYLYSTITGISLGDVVADIEGKVEFINGAFELTNMKVTGTVYLLD